MPTGFLTNINGQLIAPGDCPKIDLGRGFKYGDGFFETILIRQGKPWFVDDHLERMSDALDILGLDCQVEIFLPKVLKELSRTLAAMPPSPFSRARIHVYRQGGGTFLPESNQPGYIIEASHMDSDPWARHLPLKMGIFHHVPIAPSPLTRIKSANSLPYVMGAKHAAANGWDDAFMRSSDGYIIESTCSNLFIVHAATVVTPPVFGGCLPGIMRKNVLRLLKMRDIQVVERHLTHLDLGAADEIFLTNAIRGIMPVQSVKGTNFKAENPCLSPFILEWIKSFEPPRTIHPTEN